MEKFALLVMPFVLALTFTSNSASVENKSEAIPKENAGVQEVTTYYFIRHAEKDTSNPTNKDPELTKEGLKRAEKWAEVFKEIPFDLIYSSDFKRTRSTAKRVADSQKKEVLTYSASRLNDPNFQKNTRGKTVLVVGHSNSNPEFVNYILEEKRYKDIDDKESGSLFIVTVLPDGTKTSQVLYIN